MTLREYDAADSLRRESDGDLKGALQKLVQEAIRECRQREQAARSARQQWEEVLKTLPEAERRPFALLARLEILAKIAPEQAATVRRLRDWAESLAGEQLAHYTELFRQALPADEILEGRLSEGYRIRHVIHVRIDDRKYRATVGTAFQSRQLTGDISVDTVVEAVRGEIQRLFGRPLDPERFLVDLFKAYELALTAHGHAGRVGEPVSLLSVHKFLVMSRQSERAFHSVDPRHFRPYPPDEFAVDLGRLLESGHTRIDKFRLHLHPVRNAKESLFIVNFGTRVGQNYGLLSFLPSEGR
ncbi:hypothetical protein HRbin28_00122 [bacterium HR28]|nr:hypothetical protein HRbin28_00122 [bacterium HR28]